MPASSAPTYDLAIKNGKIATREKIVDGSLCIANGQVRGIVPTGEPVHARQSHDASGCYVLPGLIDAHVHFRDPGLAYKEGFENGSRAAAAGGVTTVLVMPTDEPMTSNARHFREKIALGARSFVDFGLQAIIGENLEDVPQLADLGCCAFELFFGDVPLPLRTKSARELMRALEAIEAVGGVAGVTPTLPSIVGALIDDFKAGQRNSPLDFARSRPPYAEAIGVALASEAAIAAGCRAHFRQISCAASVDVMATYKDRAAGLLTAEVLPHNLLLTEEDLVRQGPFAKMSPPLRADDDLARLWDGLRAQTIDIVATDHAPHLPAEKAKGKENIWESPSGIPGLETFLPLMFDRFQHGDITIERLVQTVAERPAQIFGLYPKKGTLDIGADADVVIVDPSHEWEITNDALITRARYTPFHGRRVRGRIASVFLRGKKIFEDGRVLGEASGKFVPSSRAAAGH